MVPLAQPDRVRRYRNTALTLPAGLPALLAAEPNRLRELDRYWSLSVDATLQSGEGSVPR